MTATLESSVEATMKGKPTDASPQQKPFPHPRWITKPIRQPGAEHISDGPMERAKHTVATDCPNPIEGSEYWAHLRLFAETLYDTQKIRIGINNRLGQAVESEALANISGGVSQTEHQLGRWLDNQFKRGPFHTFVKDTPGIGVRLTARLLGCIGDPAVATSVDGDHRLRLLSQLWAYCGHGDPTARPRKGSTQADLFACGSRTAKMLVHLIAESATKEQGRSVTRWRETGTFGDGPASRPLRDVYEQRRIATTDRGWTDGHSHNDALRITGKEFLRSLWIEARRLHDLPCQTDAVTPSIVAG